MKLFRHDAKTKKYDKKLFRLFAMLLTAYFLCVALFPRILYRSSGVLTNAFWRVKSIGQQREHSKHRAYCNAEHGKVVIMFDDGWMNVYEQAYPSMKEYGLRGTVAVISGSVGEYGYMNISELSELYCEGWDMANHTHSHRWLDHLDQQTQKKELLLCRKWLKQYHMTGAENIVVFPGGYSNSDTWDIMNQEGFTSARSVESYRNVFENTRYDDVLIIVVTPDLTLIDMESILDDTAAKRTSLILIFHKMEEGSDHFGMCYPPQDFDKICAMIAEKDLCSVTITELEDFLCSQAVD